MYESQKVQVAQAALSCINEHKIIGVGSGSTIAYFIAALQSIKHEIEGTIASSTQTEQLLKAQGIPVFKLHAVNELPIYFDSCDACDTHFRLTKGGGGALVREKILSVAAKKFVCLFDESKNVPTLGAFPIAVEVIPLARSLVARQIVSLGGYPVLRENFITDNGNLILDVHHLDMTNPLQVEKELNQITGVVDNGIFASRIPDIIIRASKQGVETLQI